VPALPGLAVATVCRGRSRHRSRPPLALGDDAAEQAYASLRQPDGGAGPYLPDFDVGIRCDVVAFNAIHHIEVPCTLAAVAAEEPHPSVIVGGDGKVVPGLRQLADTAPISAFLPYPDVRLGYVLAPTG
jgi:hypothetical protein